MTRFETSPILNQEEEERNMSEILRYDKVEIKYGDAVAVSDISFSVREGEILGIVGESGSGKSTIIKAAMGLLGEGAGVSSGDIIYDGKSLLNLSKKEQLEINGPNLGMIFQFAGSSFCPVRKIGTQLYEAMRAHSSISKEEFKERVSELLKKLGFNDDTRILESYPNELSGGMQQRVGVVCAMLLNPKVLLADEPTSAMDVTIQKQAVEEMVRVRDTFNTSIIIVTHNIGVVNAMADNVLVLKDGRIVEMGATKDIINNPKEEYTKKLMDAVPRLKR